MSGDLDGQDAFDRLLEVALESRVDVRRAQDERDNARSAQREAERLAADRHGTISRLEQEKKASLPKLSALWRAADRLRSAVATSMSAAGPADVSGPLEELSAALGESATVCNEIPF